VADPGGPLLVLVGAQDIVNIASAVRVAHNFGLDGMRLVDPAVFDPWRIEGIAHNTAAFVSRIGHPPTLDAALADCVWCVALTARGRAAKRTVLGPREAAAELVARRADGPVAIVAGREDKGLTNEELDRCAALVSLPTSPDYRSLNLAQAVAIMAYESWVARRGEAPPRKRPRREAPPAPGELVGRMFADWERAMRAIEFFKTRSADHVMRGFREALHRAELDTREAALIRAMGIEVVRFLERRGLPVPAPVAPAGPDAEAAHAADGQDER
jgi:tRNA/rRNA methyltransferase/tRNA (cytidine32/uridine32-2'-O)-methyltransferase